MIPKVTDGDKKNETNFTEDVRTLGKEILRTVNSKFQGNQKFEYLNFDNGCGFKRTDPISLRYVDKIEMMISYNPNSKKVIPSIHDNQEPSRYRITCSMMVSHRPLSFKLNVSEGEIYTQKEIETAKKIIMRKVLEHLNLPSSLI